MSVGEAVQAKPARRSLRAAALRPDDHRDPGAAVRGAVVDAGSARRALAGAGRGRRHGGVRRRAGRASRADVPRARPPPARLGRPHRRHHARRDLGAVRLVGARQRAAGWSSASAGVADPAAVPGRRGLGRSSVSAVLLVWGYVEAMRVPRVRRVDVTIAAARRRARRAPGGAADRHPLRPDRPGPLVGRGWSTAVNELDADIVCHTGDIADGTVAQRREQAAPLGDVRARLARTYVTGNHEYFGEAQGWLDHMRELGWEPLHNRHLVVERGGDRLVVAGVDDRTAAGVRPAPATAPTTPPRWPAPTRPARAAARPPAQADRRRGGARRRPADLRAHPRRADLAVQLPGPARPAGGARAEPARRRGPSSTPAGAPASGARRCGSSPRARSPSLRCGRFSSGLRYPGGGVGSGIWCPHTAPGPRSRSFSAASSP